MYLPKLGVQTPVDLPLDGGIEDLHLGDLRRHDHLDDHLCAAVVRLHGEVRFQVVEEHDTHQGMVIRLDHPCCTRHEEGRVPSLLHEQIQGRHCRETRRLGPLL